MSDKRKPIERGDAAGRSAEPSNGRARRPTAAAVALRANVSQSAVSRAFTPGASVSPATLARVQAAANELGYRPNAIARSLISGRSRMVGLLATYLDNQYYSIVMERLALALQSQGFQTLLFIGEGGDQERQLERLLTYQVDAAIMLSENLSSALARQCLDAAIPVVLFNRDVRDSPAGSVTSDNEQGGRLVADRLLASGHRRIAWLAGDEDSSTSRGREAGLLAGLHAAGMTLHARDTGHYRRDSAQQAARRLMSLAEPPDALFVANDHMAFAVMDTLRSELQLRVPEDVSIIGYDDVPQADWSAYALSSVAQPTDAMIAATVELVLTQLTGAPADAGRIMLPVELIERCTVAERR